MSVCETLTRLRGYLRRLVLLFIILGVLIDVRVSLWRMPYARVRAHVDDLTARGWGFRDVHPTWMARWVQRLAVLVPKATCLVWALTLQVVLARRGVDVEVVFGARRTGSGKFDAHAWVDYRGHVLLGHAPEMESYHVLRRERVKRG